MTEQRKSEILKNIQNRKKNIENSRAKFSSAGIPTVSSFIKPISSGQDIGPVKKANINLDKLYSQKQFENNQKSLTGNSVHTFVNAAKNIDKLKKRYPEGFDPTKSLNRTPEE